MFFHIRAQLFPSKRDTKLHATLRDTCSNMVTLTNSTHRYQDAANIHLQLLQHCCNRSVHICLQHPDSDNCRLSWWLSPCCCRCHESVACNLVSRLLGNNCVGMWRACATIHTVVHCITVCLVTVRHRCTSSTSIYHRTCRFGTAVCSFTFPHNCSQASYQIARYTSWHLQQHGDTDRDELNPPLSGCSVQTYIYRPVATKYLYCL